MARVVRMGWPFFVVAAAFLVLAHLGWLYWPLGHDPCSNVSLGRIPDVPVDDDFCGGKRTTAGLLVPVGLAAFGLVVGALGLVPVRRR